MILLIDNIEAVGALKLLAVVGPLQCDWFEVRLDLAFKSENRKRVETEISIKGKRLLNINLL